MFSSADYAAMSQALQLAEKGLYSTTPNPRVGCVIMRNSQIVGRGWHERAGQPHAEINALRQAGAMANNATVYVTLEPCSHYGRTPPCINALIHAGVAKVIMAMEDPNPLVSGRGGALLQQSGITVQTGLMEVEAKALNIGFISRMLHKRPWVRIKVAASLDGKTALNNGASQWITSQAARRNGHQWRARSCAVLTGIGTVKADDPQLTVRQIKTSRQPLRIVVDSRLEIPLDAKLLQGEDVIIFTAIHNKERAAALHDLGAKIIELPDMNGEVDVVRMMQQLADSEINELLVEAGSKLNGALVRAGLVDELVIFLAPHLLGDKARGIFNLPELINLNQKSELKIQDLRMVGQDIRIIAGFL
ncbi:MAG: bifunctional diaminohydroxyphosphoribosylaminopyrimidine deaminase/5-amino-6-(5-phosphoribosylamino)uracil reductase RibD [Nitrosomonas sp.]|nr:bifunctional diaminohydroxyphosphoribosylaminopyrimidine deaminase/5-amino-6-(5-phosphoribosylamino)uracil reductase RibD [Nitrosomonas sp.]MDP1951307.1 bifunctional diaminohydroxyphosphoribosylaminopyrimidine deaminase/5-amino-6-(5-phosphoribosylamino)uracil reductase RibD [Nitrosomonas sp.]